MTQITDHLADIERRIEESLERSGRAGESVTIVAVSKQQPASAVIAARESGLRHFGENYLQEGIEKIEAVADPGIEWHFIGQVQSNKTRAIAERFSWVETVDRVRVAERLSSQRPAHLGALNVLIQLNLDGEPQKAGVAAAELLTLARQIGELPNLKLRGVMSIPPAGRPEAETRRSFVRVRDEARRLEAGGFAIDTISMGMSSDFEIAIECGATSVRIGTALFGSRPAKPR